MFPVFDNYELSCYKHLGTDFRVERKFLFLWDKCLGLQVLGYMVAAYLVFKINAKEFTRVIVLFSIAMSDKRVTQLPCILTSIWCCHHFLLKHPARCVAMSYYGFNLYFLNR